MSDFLCKIWKFLVGVAKAIVDGVSQVLAPLLDLAFDILGRLLDGLTGAVSSLFGSPAGWLLLAVGGLVGYKLLFADKEKEKQSSIAYIPSTNAGER